MHDKSYTHSELVELARQWLVKKGFPVVVTEIASVGEEPDALGFKQGLTTLIECKASRSDFLADSKKFYRQNPEYGLGEYRYYFAPKGLIKVEELPEKWGLIEVGESGVRVTYSASKEQFNRIYKHYDTIILMSVIRRIGQTEPKGVSIRCYVDENKNRATVSINEQPCPKCGKPNNDDYPLTIGENVVEGGCVDCWEIECNREYWEFGKQLSQE